MRILICYPGHTISTVDVAIGWHKGLKKTGHEVFQLAYEYNVPFYGAVLEAWKEWNPEFNFTMNDTLWLASQDLVCKALELKPLDMVLIVNGLLVHERGYQLLQKLEVPVVVIHTEAPYNDHLVQPIMPYVDVLFINDRASLPMFREQNPATFYLPHSYDPERHHPPAEQMDGEYQHQVFFLGSMYEERKALFQELEEIDLGLDMQLDIYTTSMDGRGRVTGGMMNEELVKHYWGSDIVLCPNRTTKDYFEKTQITDPAWSLGPRVYEVAACGTFQLTDDGRPELIEVFGDTIPVYHDAAELAELIRYFTERPVEREAMAEKARRKVAPCSFESRAKKIFIPRVKEVLGYE